MSDDDFFLNNVEDDESSSDDQLPTLNLWKTSPKVDVDTEDGDELRITLRRIKKQRVNTDLVQALIKKGKQDVLVDAFLNNNIQIRRRENINLDAERTKSLDWEEEQFDSDTLCKCSGTKIFDVTNFQCLFRPENVTLVTCGYEGYSELSPHEKLLLSKSPSRAVHHLLKVLCMGHHNITNHSAFLLYLLRAASVSKKLLLTDSIRKYIQDFFKNVEDDFRINISVADIFEIFINFGLIVELHCASTVLKLTYEKLKNKSACCDNKCTPFEHKHWFSNLDVTIYILNQFLKYCSFSDLDLLQLFLTVLWMVVDETLIYSELRFTLKIYLENILRKFSIAFRNSGEISTAILQLGSSESHSSLHYPLLLEAIKAIPADSEKGKNLKRVTSYKILCQMLQVDGSLENSELMFSNLLFIAKQFHRHLCNFSIDLNSPLLDTMISLIDYCLGFDPVEDLKTPISNLLEILIKCRVKLKNETFKEHFGRVIYRLRVFVMRTMLEQSPFVSSAECLDEVEVSTKEEEMDVDEKFKPNKRSLISNNLRMKREHSSDRDMEVEKSDSKLSLSDTTAARPVSNNKKLKIGAISSVQESVGNAGIQIGISATKRTECDILTNEAGPSNVDSQLLHLKAESAEDNILLPEVEDMCISDSEMEFPVLSKDNKQPKMSSISSTNLEIGQSVAICSQPQEGVVTEGKLHGENSCISDVEMEISMPFEDNEQPKMSSISSTNLEIGQSVEICSRPKEDVTTEGELPGENICISDSEMEISVPFEDNEQPKMSSISSMNLEIGQSVEIGSQPKGGVITEEKLHGKNICISDSKMEIPVPSKDIERLKMISIYNTSCEIGQSVEICSHSKGSGKTEGDLHDENKIDDCTFAPKNHDCNNSISMGDIAKENLKSPLLIKATGGENRSFPGGDDMVISDSKNELPQLSENDSQQIKNVMKDELIQTERPTSVTPLVPQEKDDLCDIKSPTVPSWSLNYFYEQVCESKKEAKLLSPKEKEVGNKLRNVENATLFCNEHNYSTTLTVDAPYYKTSLFDNAMSIGANVVLDSCCKMVCEDSDGIYELQSATDTTSPSKSGERIRSYNQNIPNYEHDYSLNCEIDKNMQQVNISADQIPREHLDENRSTNFQCADNSEEKVLSVDAPLTTKLSTSKDTSEVQQDSTMTYTSFSSNELEQSVKIRDVQQEPKSSPTVIILSQNNCDKCQTRLTAMRCKCAEDPCTVVEYVPFAREATSKSDSLQTTDATDIFPSTTAMPVSSHGNTITFYSPLPHEDVEIFDVISDSENMEDAEILPKKAIVVSETSSLALSNQLPSGNIQHASVISIANEIKNTDAQLNVPPQLPTACHSSNTQGTSSHTNSLGPELTKSSLQSVGNVDSLCVSDFLSKLKDFLQPSVIQPTTSSSKSPVLFESSNLQFAKSISESHNLSDPSSLQIARPSSKSPVHFGSSNDHSSPIKHQTSFDSVHVPPTTEPQLSCESLGGPSSSSRSQDFNSLDSQATCVTRSKILDSYSVMDYLKYIKTKKSSYRSSPLTDTETSENPPTASSNFSTNPLATSNTTVEIESLTPVSVQEQVECVDSQQNETAISEIDVLPSRDQQPNVNTNVRPTIFSVKKETTHERRQESISSSKELGNGSANSFAGITSSNSVPVPYGEGAASDGEIEVIEVLQQKGSVTVWNDKTRRHMPPSDSVVSTEEPIVTSSQSLNTTNSYVSTNHASADLNSSLHLVSSLSSSNVGAFTHELSTVSNINVPPPRETLLNDDSTKSHNVQDDLDVIISNEITRKSPELITISDTEEEYTINEDDSDTPTVEYIQCNGIIFID